MHYWCAYGMLIDYILLFFIVGCNPKPEISWKFNGKPIETGGRYKITNNGNTRTLLIKKLQDSDVGVYECTAKNR